MEGEGDGGGIRDGCRRAWMGTMGIMKQMTRPHVATAPV